MAPQIIIPYVRSGWIRAWYSCSKVFRGSTCFSLHIIPTDRATLTSKTLICSLKRSLLSMKTSKYLALDTKVIGVSFLVTLRLVSRLELLASVGGTIRMQVFERFIVSLLTEHHIFSLSSS